MGMYIYRVTARMVRLDDGRKAHVAQYAYKPWGDWDGRKINARLHFKTGCVASEGMRLKTPLLVVFNNDHEHEGHIYQNVHGLRTFYDDATFGTEHMPCIGTVQRIGMLNKYSVTLKVTEAVA